MKKILLILSALLLISGCGGGHKSISVTLSPSAQTAIDAGQALNLTATVAHDSSGEGVIWSMSSTSCSGTACGTFSNQTATSATYNAPTSVTTSMTVTITATSAKDSGKSSSATVIVAPSLTISTTSLAGGTVGTAYSVNLKASGGAGTLTWSLASGSSLPAGLSLSSSGAIFGTPTAPGTTTFTVKVTDSSGAQGGALSATQQLSLTIKPAQLTITTTALSNGVAGTAYSASPAATGGTGAITWSVTTGSLPAGLSLSGSTISGTPTATGTSTFTVTATDSGSPQQTASKSLSITINPKLTITTTTVPNGVIGTAYTASLGASGGVGTITWSVATGTLPAGLTLSTAGAISGTPTAAGSSSFTVLAKDSGTPQQTVQQALSIIIYAGLAITTTSLPNGTVNSAYSAILTSGGGTGTVTWSVTAGSLPAGLSLSGSTISGTPTTVGASNFTVSATDSSTPPQTKTQALTIVISPALSITTTSLPDGTLGTAYSESIQTSGGTLPFTWSVTSGSLPAGLTLAGNSTGVGVISGTPTASGSSTFTVTAKDSSTPPVSVNQQLTLVINVPPLTVTTTTLPNGRTNTAYSAPLQVSGGMPPYTWTVASGSTLPSWLTLSGSGTSWKLSGTPTAVASSTFTLTVTDSSSPKLSKNQTLTLAVISATACGTGNESMMKGQFAFILSGWTADGFLAAIGSFTADGNGNITDGYVDANSERATGNGLGVQSSSITTTGSSYSVGSDNRGCATIVTPFYTFITRFAISPTPVGAAQGTMIELEPVPQSFVATGQIFQQQVPAAVPLGNWVHAQLGAIDTSEYESWLQEAGVDVYGSGGQITNGEYDFQSYGALTQETGVKGTYTAPDPTTGRYTLTTTGTLGPLSGNSLNRAAYLVSGTHILEITTTANTILAGEMRLQSGSLTLSGKLAAYGSALNSGVAGFGLMNATGSSYTASIYLDSAGTWDTPTPVPTTCSYTVDSLGRVVTSGTNCGSAYGYPPGSTTLSWTAPPVIYLTGPNTGVEMGGAGIWMVAPQSATSITSGNYYFGTQNAYENGNNLWEGSSGVATITGGDSLTGTEDTLTNQQADVPISATLTVNSDGTFSTSTNPGVIVGLVISNKQFIEVEDESTQPRMQIYNVIP